MGGCPMPPLLPRPSLFPSLFLLPLLFPGLESSRCYNHFLNTQNYVPGIDDYGSIDTIQCKTGQEICTATRIATNESFSIILGCTAFGATVYNCLAASRSRDVDDEWRHCWDMDKRHFFVPEEQFLRARMCCCAGDDCNKIERVHAFESVIPYEAIQSEFMRFFYGSFVSLSMTISIFFALAGTVLIYHIVLASMYSEKQDEVAWQDEGVAKNPNKMSWSEEASDEEEKKTVDAKKAKEKHNDSSQVKNRKKTKKRGKKKKLSMETQDTQEEVTAKSEEMPAKESEKEDDKAREDAEEKKDVQQDEKKEPAGGTFFSLPKGPKRLANGRLQYVSMINENSEYSDD